MRQGVLPLGRHKLRLRKTPSDLKSSDCLVPMKKTNDNAQVPIDPPIKKVRKYTGPPKGSEEAKERMARVRAAQYAKNNLVYASRSAQ